MPVPRPTEAEIDSAAEHYGFHLADEDRTDYAAIVDGALTSYDEVERLYAETAPTAPTRTYDRPDTSENPLGAWYVTSSITAADSGPLARHRVAIKDNVAVAGLPMMNGSRALEGFTPARDATAVTRLLAAGAEIAGKSVCEDLCFSGSSFTSVTGPVRNPWDRTRESGGSSSGSAALVAAGEVDLALGGDQGGSVRIPSAFCGTVGHKPTFGLVPYTGAFPIERTIDHLGPIARTVADAALMLSVLAGRDEQDPRQPAGLVVDDYVGALARELTGAKIGVLDEGFGHDASQPEVDDAVRAAARRFEGIGASVDRVSVPWHRHAFHVWNVIATDGGAYQMLDGNGWGLNADGTYDPELIAHFGAGRVARAEALSETVKLVALCGYHGVRTLSAATHAKARNLVAPARAAYDRALAEYDVLVMPTVPYVARELPLGTESRGERIGQALGMIANTAPFNVTGHPAISVPAGLVDGLPVGMMIVGRHFADATVLRIAHAFEQLVGGFPVPPTVHAEALA